MRWRGRESGQSIAAGDVKETRDGEEESTAAGDGKERRATERAGNEVSVRSVLRGRPMEVGIMMWC